MTDNLPTDWLLQLPDWVTNKLAEASKTYVDDTARMALAIDLAAGNITAGAGGPFGAAVFDESTGGLVAAGVNLVFASGASIAHAEIVALTLAQQAVGSANLSQHSLTLVTSTEPCAMCLGALPWAGISRLVCGARDADARASGFDEGAKPQGWVEALGARGITVTRNVLRPQAVAILDQYVQQGGRIY